MNKIIRAIACALIFTALLSSTNAQVFKKSTSEYNLKHVSVTFLDRPSVKGKLLRASHDSLVMRDKNKIAVGCKVSVKFKHTTKLLDGKVLEITDSSLIIENKDRTIVLLKQIVHITVTSYPPMADLRKFQVVVYKPSFIKSIHMHKKGSGGLGGLVGFVAGIGIGAATIPQPTGQNVYGNAVGSILSGVIGIPIGMILFSSGKTYTINGQQEKYDLFVRKLYK